MTGDEIYIYIHMYMYMYICMYMCIYIYIYIYDKTLQFPGLKTIITETIFRRYGDDKVKSIKTTTESHIF